MGHPGNSDDVVDYVLHKAPAGEQTLLDDAVDRALSVFPSIAAGDFNKAMNVLHRKTGEE